MIARHRFLDFVDFSQGFVPVVYRGGLGRQIGNIGLQAVIHAQIGGLASAKLAQAVEFAFADEIVLTLLVLARLDPGEVLMLLKGLFVGQRPVAGRVLDERTHSLPETA